MKTITLCADDYGQNHAISQGILTLVKQGRLSAVSCMTNYPYWPHYAEQLAALKAAGATDNLDIGLHFDLTDFIARRGWSFNQFIINCCLQKVDLQAVETELIQQLEAFENALGMPPDFVDGHQHVQAFPGIRTIFIKTLAQRYAGRLPYIRWSAPQMFGHDSLVKAIILRLLVTGFAPLAGRQDLRFPGQFLGIYSLTPTRYADLFKGWLGQAEDGALFMCHPGLASEDPEDPIKKARLVEFTYFTSDTFLTDLHNNRTRLGKWMPAQPEARLL